MSATPWRVVRASNGGCWQVWTKYDSTPGSRNNYVVADGIQNEGEANLFAAAPELLQALAAVLMCNHELGAISRPVADRARAAIVTATGNGGGL